ncbi:filamin-A [Drosophila tropicalis]|uniref:filamin-A n=1 Tax=Drosophila tropicalis TaxID=46794 RepID=UPI0035ABBA2D
MFKVSQEIRLNINAAGSASSSSIISGTPDPEKDGTFGRYQRTPEADAYPTEPPHVYIAPELTDPSKVQLMHFPNGAMRVDSELNFIIKRNGVKGNFDVRLEGPSGQPVAVHQQQLDPERFQIESNLNVGAGLYKVHIKCNSVPLPRSPFIIVVIGEGTNLNQLKPDSVFQSDASKVQSRGLGLSHINLVERNEFTVDASQAGHDMLFVGILGPKGYPCDEVFVKHLGRNVHRVIYRVSESGAYTLIAKWGDKHVPGSPFRLSAE